MAFSSKLAADFAVNLRILCKKKKSIAEVCRATQIHRQQFNKYLAGNSLPNAHNLSKICNYLGVTAEVLFAQIDGQEKINGHIPPQSVGIQHLFDPHLDPAHTHSELPNSPSCNAMQSGFYFCYFPFLGGESMIVRSLIRVRNVDNRTLFTRLTRLGNPKDSRSFIARGRHVGNILRTADEISLIGVNKQSPNQISLINLHHRPTFNGHYFGLAITKAAEKSFVCRTAVEYLNSSGTLSTKQLLKSLGILRPNDPSVPKQIHSALLNTQDSAPQVIVAPSSDEIIANAVAQ